MKKLLTLLIVTPLITAQLVAQSVQLENVTKEGFTGIERMGDDGYYVRFIEGAKGKAKTKLMHIYALDNGLNVVSDFTLELKSTEKVEDVGYNGENFMIIYSSYGDRTRTFVVLDKDGEQVAENKATKVNRRLLSKPAAVMPYGKDFLVLNYIKEKKVGYSIDRYNSNLESVYSVSQLPDKKKLYPVDYRLQNDKIYILEFLSTGTGTEYFEYHMAAFDATSGKQLYKNYLKDEDANNSGYATFVKLDDAGKVYTGGMYFNGNRTKKNNSDGFFAAVIEADGKMNFSSTDWKDVKSDLKDEGNAAFWGGKTKTFVHDLALNGDGSFTVIGENYRRGSADLAGDKKGASKALGVASKVGRLSGGGSDDEPEETAFTVSSFALFDFDQSGNFTNIRKVDKPNSVTIIKDAQDPDDPVYWGQFKGLNLANMLNNKGYFPYRFVAERSGGEKVLVFHQRYEPLSKEYLYSTPLSSTDVDTVAVEISSEELKFQQELKKQEFENAGKLGGLGKFAQKMQKMSDKGNALTGADKQNELFLRGSDDPLDFRAKSASVRTLLSNNKGKIVIYDFMPVETTSKGSLAQMMSNTVGSLKVWEMDVP